MSSIKLKSYVPKNGDLTIKVPPELRDKEVEITITLSPEDLGWPPGFFEATAGSIPDLERMPQGSPEKREPIE